MDRGWSDDITHTESEEKEVDEGPSPDVIQDSIFSLDYSEALRVGDALGATSVPSFICPGTATAASR